jgi:hypothetical protein
MTKCPRCGRPDSLGHCPDCHGPRRPGRRVANAPAQGPVAVPARPWPHWAARQQGPPHRAPRSDETTSGPGWPE